MNTNELKTINIDELNKKSTITTNVEQEYIVITYDKIKLILFECENYKKLASSWWSYLGMTISFLFPCFTAEFKPFFGVDGKIIESIFILMSIFWGAVTIVSLIRRISNRKKISIEYCADRIKNNS